MTAADRQRIREAIDAHQRARRAQGIDAGELLVCAGCGCDSDLRSIGCKSCHDRHRKRARRAAGLYREQRTEEGKARKRQRENERRARLRALKAAAS